MAQENPRKVTRSQFFFKNIGLEKLCANTPAENFLQPLEGTTNIATPHENGEIETSTSDSEESVSLSFAIEDDILLTTLIAGDSIMAVKFSDVQFGDLMTALRPTAGVVKTISPKGLPSFRGDLLEDCDEFLEKFEGCADAYRWDDDDRKRHFPLVLKKVSYEWYAANKGMDWSDLRDSFREEFGKNQVDYDLAGESGKMLFSEDPRSYVYHVLSYVQATNPKASENEKLIRLFDGLPTNLKKYFVRNKPGTVDEFTERLKDIKREQLYEQKSLLQQIATVTPSYQSGILASQMSANNLANQGRASEHAAASALATSIAAAQNGLTGLTPPITNVYTDSLIIAALQQIAARPTVTQTYANLPLAPSATNSNAVTKRHDEETEALRRQIDQLSAQLRNANQQGFGGSFQRSNNYNNLNQNIRQDGRTNCHKCGKPGHIARFCLSKPRRQAGQSFDGGGRNNVG